MARRIQLSISSFKNEQYLQLNLFSDRVSKYEDLKALAATAYSKIFPPSRWTVSFRLRHRDTFLGERLIPIEPDLWNSGVYFKFMYANDGVLEVVAYFVLESETFPTDSKTASEGVAMSGQMTHSLALRDIPTINLIPATPPTSPNYPSLDVPAKNINGTLQTATRKRTT